MERNNLELIIRRIKVYEDHLEIERKADVDTLIRCRHLENAVNFEQGSMDILKTEVVQTAIHRKDKVYAVNVISEGNPLRACLNGFLLQKIEKVRDISEQHHNAVAAERFSRFKAGRQ